MSPTAQLAVYAALLAGFFFAALWRPAVSLAAILCIYGLKQWGQTSSSWLATHSPFTNYAIGAIVLGAIVVGRMRGKCVLCNVRSSTWVVIALYCYALFSLLWTPRPDLALQMWQYDAPYVVTAILLAPLAVHDSDDLYRAYFALSILGGVLVFALLLLAKWGDRGVLISGASAELETNPLAIANLGGAVASCAMFLRTRRFPIVSWVLRLVVVAAALALIVKSGSRGQLIATLATLILMLPVAFKISQVRGLVPVLLAVGVIGYAAQYSAQSYIRSDDERWSSRSAADSASDRWRMCQELLSHWADSPTAAFLGLGNGAALDPNVVGSYPHDIPIETLCEEGAFGFALYLTINWLALKGLRDALAATKGNDQLRRLLAIAGANFIFQLITTLKEGNMVGSVEFFMAAILLARMPEMLSPKTQPLDVSVSDTVPAAPRFANIMR